MGDSVDFENDGPTEIFKNVMIIDKLFKANGHIHNACLDLYQNDQHFSENSVNGFDISIDDSEATANFVLFSSAFRFVIESETIFCLYGATAVQIETSLPDDNIESELEDFYQMLLALINIKLKRSFDRIDQFIDEYNLQYMTQY